MKLTRRSILQLTGATGAIGLATGGTGVHAAANAAQTALNVGDGPYVLTHDGRILARVGNYHDAVRQAAELRQTMQAPIAHQRCSQELWRTLGEKAGQHAETLWHEVDGLAVTPDEMEERAFEFLRRAKVPEAARKKLWRHHAEALREDCMLRQQARDDLKAYACLNGQIIAVGHDVEDLAQTHDEPDITFFSCTPELATALERHLAEPDTPQPDIETSFLVHMTPRELTELTASDPWYAAAAQMRAEKKPRHVPESSPVPMPVETHLCAIAPARTSSETDQGPRVRTLSPMLAAALADNGIIYAGFWREVSGVLHHLDEFADTVPQPSLAGRQVRHQNRHV